MRTNYVLVDFENVQPESVELLADECFRLIVFVGAGQAKLPIELVASVQRLGCRAEYLRISGIGPNALDFHIAYYLGKIAASDPSASFHIISKDTGFDPLVRHLRKQGMWVCRSASIGEMPVFRARTMADRVGFAWDRLRRMGAARPKSPGTLGKSIAHMFSGQLTEDEVSAIVRGLVGGGRVAISGEAVSYAVPAEG